MRKTNEKRKKNNFCFWCWTTHNLRRIEKELQEKKKWTSGIRFKGLVHHKGIYEKYLALKEIRFFDPKGHFRFYNRNERFLYAQLDLVPWRYDFEVFISKTIPSKRTTDSTKVEKLKKSGR